MGAVDEKIGSDATLVLETRSLPTFAAFQVALGLFGGDGPHSWPHLDALDTAAFQELPNVVVGYACGSGQLRNRHVGNFITHDASLLYSVIKSCQANLTCLLLLPSHPVAQALGEVLVRVGLEGHDGLKFLAREAKRGGHLPALAVEQAVKDGRVQSGLANQGLQARVLDIGHCYVCLLSLSANSASATTTAARWATVERRQGECVLSCGKHGVSSSSDYVVLALMIEGGCKPRYKKKRSVLGQTGLNGPV
jgi:hypothetical protein